MFAFHAEPLHELDEAGNLVGTTVVWSTEREFCSEAYDVVMMSIPIGVVALLYLSSSGAADASLQRLTAAGLFVLGLVLFHFGHRLCTTRRELTFHDNGAIAVPRNWLTNWLWGPRVLGDHRQIATIQIQEEEIPDGEPQRPQPNRRRRYEVWFYLKSGYSHPVIRGLLKQDAHHVSVLLEQALAEITDTPNIDVRWADVTVD